MGKTMRHRILPKELRLKKNTTLVSFKTHTHTQAINGQIWQRDTSKRPTNTIKGGLALLGQWFLVLRLRVWQVHLIFIALVQELGLLGLADLLKKHTPCVQLDTGNCNKGDRACVPLGHTVGGLLADCFQQLPQCEAQQSCSWCCLFDIVLF